MKRANPKIIARAVLIVLALVAAAGPSSAAPVEPAGWYAGDMHVHRSCGGSPEAVSSLYTKMSTNNLAAISLLADMGNGEVQDPGTDLPRVNGQDDPSSTPGRIVHWDTEWHWDATYSQYAHQALGGHIVALGLSGASQIWQEYTFPILDWARQQGGIAGFAHMQYLGYGIPQSLNCCIPIEYPVEVALGSADFISEDVNGSDTAIQAYYRLLNTGFRPGFAAGTDYPCGVSTLGFPADLCEGRQWPDDLSQLDRRHQGGKNRRIAQRTQRIPQLEGKQHRRSGRRDQAYPQPQVCRSPSYGRPARSSRGTIELLRNGVVIASKRATVPANGSVTLSATAPSDDKSSWLAARRMGSNGHVVHTGAVFVTVKICRCASARRTRSSMCDWMDNLLAKTSPGGEWNSYFPPSWPQRRPDTKRPKPFTNRSRPKLAAQRHRRAAERKSRARSRSSPVSRRPCTKTTRLMNWARRSLQTLPAILQPCACLPTARKGEATPLESGVAGTAR